MLLTRTRTVPTVAPAVTKVIKRRMPTNGVEQETVVAQTTEVIKVKTPRPVIANSALAKAMKASEAAVLIDEQLAIISAAEKQIDDAQEALSLATMKVESLLRGANMSYHTNGVYLAEMVENWSRQQRNIDPKKFKNAVANDVFWNSISVSVGEASKVLSDKEIAEIADVVPSVSQGVAIKIKKLEPKKRSK